MRNAMLAELYKLKNSKLLKVLIIIDIVLPVFLSLHATDFDPHIKIPGQYAVYFLPPLSFFITAMLVLFCSTSITGEFSSCTFKNAIPSGIGRGRLYFAKLASSFLVMLLLAVLMTAALTITNTFINGWHAPETFASEIIVFAACILFLAGYAAIFNAVSFLTRRPGAAMAVNMVLFFSELILLLNLGSRIRFRDLLLSTYIQYLFPPSTTRVSFQELLFSDTMLNGILLAAAVIIVTAVSGSLAFRRYEIK